MRLQKTILPFCLIFYSFACKKHRENPCAGLQTPGARFVTQEILHDTAFDADTMFWDNGVIFKAIDKYENVLWKVGNDPRNFTNTDFALNFYQFIGTVNINFTGRKTPNPQCFPGDSGVYSGSKKITLVEQFDRANLTKSPLLGRYKGAFTNRPTDSFIVRIEYFDSAKYDVTVTGTKNFYWVSNFPKNFRDTTSSSGLAYPELSYGQETDMGYKCMRFGSGGSITSGLSVGELKNNMLIIYYRHPDTGRSLWQGVRQ